MNTTPEELAKLKKYSGIIAGGLDGMEGDMLKKAKNDWFHYYGGLITWLKESQSMTEPDALLCIRIAHHNSFARFLGSQSVPKVLVA